MQLKAAHSLLTSDSNVYNDQHILLNIDGAAHFLWK